MPPMLAGFVDALMGPFNAIGEAGMMLKDTVMGIGKTFMFLGKGALKVVVKAFRALSFILKPIPIAIGIAIGAAIFLIYKFRDSIGNFIDAVKTIPGKIKNFFKEAFITLKNFFIDAINGIITLINKIPGVEIEKLERAGEKTLVDDKDTEKKKEMKAIIAEAEKDQAQKEKILKDLEVPESPPFTVPNLNIEQRTKTNAEFASAGTNGNTVINNVIGGSQQNVASNSASINTLSGSKNIDSTMINLESVPV